MAIQYEISIYYIWYDHIDKTTTTNVKDKIWKNKYNWDNNQIICSEYVKPISFHSGINY